MPEVEKIILDLEAQDNASKSVDRVQKRIAALRAEFKSTRTEAEKLNRALDGENVAFKSTADNVDRVRKRGELLSKTMRNVREEIEKTTGAQNALENRRSVGTQQLGSLVQGAAGSVIAQQLGQGTGSINDTIEGIKALKDALPELASNLGISKQSAAALGVEAVALAGAFVIIKGLAGDISDQANAVKIAVGGQIDALTEYNDLVQKATTDDVQQRLVELAETRAAKGKLLEDLYAIKLSIDEGLDASGPGAARLTGNLLKIGDALGIVDFGLDDLNDAIANTEKELTGGNRLFNLLVQALNDGTIAANDAAQREREYTAAKLEGLELQRRITQESATITGDQLQKRLDALQAERAAYEEELTALQALEQNEQVVAQIEAVNERLGDLNEETRLLEAIAGPAAQAHDELAKKEAAAAEAAKGLAKAVDVAQKVYQSAAAQQAKNADDLAAAEQKRLDAAQEYAQKSVEIEQDRDLKLIQEAEEFALKRVNELADHYKDLADLDRQFYEDRGKLLEDLQSDLNNLDLGLGEDLAGLKSDLKDDLTGLTQERLDALRDYNQEALRASEDHYKRLSDIQRRAQNDIRSASARLDALGIYEAQRNAEEQLAVENDRYATEQKRREEDFRDQQREFERERRQRLQEYKKAENDLRARYQKERSERLATYRKELQDLTRKHAQERQATIAAFNEAIRREDQQRALQAQHQQQAWALEDQRRANQYQQEQDQLGRHYSALLTATSNGLYQVELAYQAWLDSMAARTGTSGGSVSGGGSSGNLVFAAGGYPPVNRDVMVGERGPELVRFLQPARVYANGQRPSALDGATINIYVDGSRSPMQTAYVTRRELESLLRSQR